MPNPFVPVTMPGYSEVRERLLKVARGLASTQSPEPLPPVTPEGGVIPEPVDPQMEGRQRYFPYRGIETHGVPSPDPTVTEDAEGYGKGTVDVVYDETPKGGAVIDVRVISDSAEQLKAWRVNQLTVPPAGNPPAMIASRQRERTKLEIKNMSTTDGMWISPESNVSAFNGYFLAAGASQTLSSTEAVYALSNSAALVPVCMLTEFTQEA